MRGWEGGIRLDRYPDDMPSAFDPCTNGTTPKDTPSGSGFSDGYGAFFAFGPRGLPVNDEVRAHFLGLDLPEDA